MVGTVDENLDTVIPKGTEMNALGQRLVLAEDCTIKNGTLGDYEFTEKPENMRAAILALRIEWYMRIGRVKEAARGREYMAEWERSAEAA